MKPIETDFQVGETYVFDATVFVVLERVRRPYTRSLVWKVLLLADDLNREGHVMMVYESSLTHAYARKL